MLFIGALAASFEIVNDDCYYTNEYEIYLNDKYIKVKHPSTGNIREVRWYNFQEYAAAYGKAAEEPLAGCTFLADVGTCGRAPYLFG